MFSEYWRTFCTVAVFHEAREVPSNFLFVLFQTLPKSSETKNLPEFEG